MQKHQADTAIAVYHGDIVPTLGKRQQDVYGSVVRYIGMRGTTPTSSELLVFMRGCYPDHRLDVNSVRPRLTELELAGRVVKAGKRRCRVTGKIVTTWDVKRPDRLF